VGTVRHRLMLSGARHSDGFRAIDRHAGFQ
jgi:hypothetical protein